MSRTWGKGVDEQDILYINFENLDFEEISDYKKLNTYVKEHKEKNKQYLFFDEIQHVSGFEKAINSFRVSFDCSIFITGSSCVCNGKRGNNSWSIQRFFTD